MVNQLWVEKDEAPQAKRSDARRDGRMKEFDALMIQVIDADGKVLKLAASADESARAIRLRVAQSINRVEKDDKRAAGLHAWTGPDDNVYVEYKPTAAGTNGTESSDETVAEPEAEAAPTRGRRA